MARNRYDMDEVLEEKFDINQVKRLAKYDGTHKKKMILALFLMLFVCIFINISAKVFTA